jgi:hypothetical protein
MRAKLEEPLRLLLALKLSPPVVQRVEVSLCLFQVTMCDDELLRI